MDTTLRQKLPYPHEDDVGALALYMQELATRADARLHELVQDIQAAVDVPTAVFENLSDIQFPYTATYDSLPVEVVFSNVELQYTTFAQPPFPGLWHIGFWVSMTPVGTATAGSFRRADLTIWGVTSTGWIQLHKVECVEYEGGGTEHLQAETAFYVDPNDPTHQYIYIDIGAAHGNTGSQIQIPAGQARLWLTYGGAGDLLSRR